MTKELLGVDELTLATQKSKDAVELLEILVEDVMSHRNANVVSRDQTA
jgi:hypothetical protein